MLDLTLTIAGTDRTGKASNLHKSDNLDSQADILTFDIEAYTGQTYVPAVNDEVVLTDGATTIFGGIIVQVDLEYDQAMRVTTHTVTAKDYGHLLDRRIVLERYDGMTADDILSALVLKYASDFDTLYVDCPIDITSVIFNNITMTAAFNKISQLTNYQWYIDYDKHVHFYSKASVTPTLSITDGDGNYIPDTLRLKQDITQIKNRVTVVGGEETVNPVTYTIKGDKGLLQDDGSKTFTLNYKFSAKPDVQVNAVDITVGVVGIDASADFQAMWSYEQKYLTFDSASAPADADDVTIAGIPLETIQVRVQDTASIAAYGLWEQVLTVPNITTKDEAVQYAEAERDAYKNPQWSGQFDTYNSGLRSGQVVQITSTKMGVNESFIVQSVQFKMLGPTTGYWTANITTLRELNILDILARIATPQESGQLTTTALISYIEFDDEITVDDSGWPTFSTTTGPYQVWPASGAGTGSAFNINFGTVSA